MVVTFPIWGADRPVIAAQAGGSLFVLYHDVYTLEVGLQRLLPNGQLAPGWPANGIDPSVHIGPQGPSAVIADGFGGVYAAWAGGYPGPSRAIVGRFGADGVRAAGWPDSGRSTQFAPTESEYGFSHLHVEDTSGVYVAWDDGRYIAPTPNDTQRGVMMTRLTSTGDLAPGWPVSGADPCSCGTYRGQYGLGLFPGAPPLGGAVVVWNERYSIRAQRLLRDGTRAPGWPREAVAMGVGPAGHGYAPHGACPDGAGGAYAAWDDYRHAASDFDIHASEIYAGHVLADGRLDPRWPVGGLPAVRAPGGQYVPAVAPDGYGGLFLSWTDIPSQANAYLLRLRDDGTVYPGWPATGARISTRPGYQWMTQLVPDGLGGVYILWEEGFEEYAFVQHLGPDGLPAPGWTAEGREVSPNYFWPEAGARITPDGAGGAYVVWSDGGILRAQRYGPEGIVPVQLALEDVQASSERVVLRWWAPGAGVLAGEVWRRSETSAWQSLGRATMAGADALAYEDRTVSPGERYAYQLRVAGPDGESATPEAWVSVPGAPVLRLAGARPNPTRASELRVAFTLASASAAELSLYDVSGRRVASRAVGTLGAGEHVVRLAEGVRLEPGLYWLRLAQGDERRTARVVVAE